MPPQLLASLRAGLRLQAVDPGREGSESLEEELEVSASVAEKAALAWVDGSEAENERNKA